jgi:hypothetical protein
VFGDAPDQRLFIVDGSFFIGFSKARLRALSEKLELEV